MGRIDPAPPRPGRVARRTSVGRNDPLAIRRSGSGSGPAIGCVVVVILAAALVAFVGYEVGKQAHPGEAPVAVAPSPTVRMPAWPNPPPPQEAQAPRAAMETTNPLPLYGEPPAGASSSAESLHDKMARCLSFLVEDDEVHSVSRQFSTQVRVTVRNSCDFSFVGSDVWFEARAIPMRGGGTAARKVAPFTGGPIEARGRAELVTVLECPACYSDTHTYEVSLWSPSGAGRTE